LCWDYLRFSIALGADGWQHRERPLSHRRLAKPPAADEAWEVLRLRTRIAKYRGVGLGVTDNADHFWDTGITPRPLHLGLRLARSASTRATNGQVASDVSGFAFEFALDPEA